MNPIRSGIPAQQYAASNSVSQPLELSGSQAQRNHPATLSPAQVSHNALQDLDTLTAQPDVDYQRLASEVRNALQDGTLRLQSTSRMDATYQAVVKPPAAANSMSIAHLTSTDLTIHARLNDQSQYDIIGANLHGPSISVALDLPDPPPASTRAEASSASGQQVSVSSQLAAQYSRGQLAHALIQLGNPQDFSGAPLPSGASVGSQSMVFSHAGSTGASVAVRGPRRTQPTHASRTAPYAASAQTSEGTQPRRNAATDDQIREHLYNDDGSLRSQRAVSIALNAAGYGVGFNRINTQLVAAGAVRLPNPTDEQIKAHLYNDDGSLRIQKDVTSALHAAGFTAGHTRVREQLHAAGATRHLPSATDEQIRTHLRNDDGSLRTRADVNKALHAVGLGASDTRLATQLQAAGGARKLPGATDEQIRAHLRNADDTLRIKKDVIRALHAIGLGASEERLTAQLRAAEMARPMPSATDEEIGRHLHNDDGSLRSRAVSGALHAPGVGAGEVRIGAALRKAREEQ